MGQQDNGKIDFEKLHQKVEAFVRLHGTMHVEYTEGEPRFFARLPIWLKENMLVLEWQYGPASDHLILHNPQKPEDWAYDVFGSGSYYDPEVAVDMEKEKKKEGRITLVELEKEMQIYTGQNCKFIYNDC